MKKQEKKARSSAFQKFLKRVENLGSAYENGTQNVKQVRSRYEKALNELENQASDMAKKARAALKLKEADKKKQAGKKKKAAKPSTAKQQDKKAKSKKADQKPAKKKDKAKKDVAAKSKKSGTTNKSTKGKKDTGAKKGKATKKKSAGKKSGWGDNVAAVPTARRKVVADFTAETRAKRDTKPTQKDDLRLVTGIGAAIETKLNEAGIYTLEHLASASVPRLQSILNEAGGYYRRFDPKSWPNQAKRLQDAGGGRLN